MTRLVVREIPKGPSRQWRKLKEPVLDDEIRAAVSLGMTKAHPPGEHDYERRDYETLVHNGCKSKADAEEVKRALFRAAKRLNFSLSAEIEQAFGGWAVRFTPKCKECGTAYVIKTYGDDRSKWPYDPLRRRNEQDHE